MDKQRHLYRRIGDIKRYFDENEELFKSVVKSTNIGGFCHAVSMYISDMIAQDVENTTSNPDFDYVTFRNQIQLFIQSHFYDEMREFYNENRKPLSESKDISFLRRQSKIKNLVDSGINGFILHSDICDQTFTEFLTEICWQVSDKSNELGIDTYKPGMIDQIHRWVRNNFSLYIREEYDRLIEEEGCNDYNEDDDDLSGFLYGADNIQ